MTMLMYFVDDTLVVFMFTSPFVCDAWCVVLLVPIVRQTYVVRALPRCGVLIMVWRLSSVVVATFMTDFHLHEKQENSFSTLNSAIIPKPYTTTMPIFVIGNPTKCTVVLYLHEVK